MHSFLAIELLTICKNAKNYFSAQENSRYSVRKQVWLFLPFCVYKNVLQKKGFCIWMKIMMTVIIKRQRARLYTQRETNYQTFLYRKIQTLFKKLDNFRYVFIYKKQYTWHYEIFMKFLKLAFEYTNSMTLCVTWHFYIQKARHLAKKKDNLRYVFIYKNTALLRYTILHCFLNK